MILRIALLILVGCLSISSLVGCGRGTSAPPAAPSSTTTASSSSISASDDAAVSSSSSAGTLQAVSAGATGVAGEDWLQWRGPGGNGTAAGGQTIPTSWSKTENVKWSTPVPGRGFSSPTIVGDRIYLTTADRQAQTQSLVAFDRGSGRQLWKKDLNTGGLPRKIHNKNSHATPTVASNGKQLFVSFANHDQVQVTALDLDGNQIWQKPAGPFTPKRYGYGYAPSPTLHGSLVIIAADFDAKNGSGGYIVGLDQASGGEKWRTKRPVDESYSSPIVARTGGRNQILISGCKRVSSYDPKSGRELWNAAATTSATCGTVVWNDSMVFASGGYPKSETAGIDSKSGRVVWRHNKKCYEQSMLIVGAYLYAVTDRGVAYCWKASDGSEQWAGRLGGKISSSPTLAGNVIYQANERGETFVFKASPQSFELIGSNRLGDEGFASPTICGNRMYLRVADSSAGRRQEYLYCIGN